MRVSKNKINSKVKVTPRTIKKPELLYNLDNLIDMLNGDNDMLYNIINIFIDNTPKELKKIESAIDKGQIQKINFVLHKVRPSVELVSGKKFIRKFTYVQVNCRCYIEKRDLKVIVLNLVKNLYELVAQLKEFQGFYIERKYINKINIF